jgi:hypothetical protein
VYVCVCVDGVGLFAGFRSRCTAGGAFTIVLAPSDKEIEELMASSSPFPGYP